LQILAGITSTDIVTDPRGVLHPGDEHVIPFRLNEADISADIVLLAPAPLLIEFVLKTPNGIIIQPSMSGSANISFAMGLNSAYYRITLPVPVGSGGSGAGEWQAILRMSGKERTGFSHNEGTYYTTGINFPSLPYSLNVYSYSNLKMTAKVYQNSFEPGADVTIRAIITQYGLPVENIGFINAAIRNPDNTQFTLSLKKTGPGIFEDNFKATIPGVYRIYLTASGRTLRGLVFSREQLLTATVYRGGDNPVVIPPSHGENNLCSFLKCLLERKVITEDLLKRFETYGINWKQLLECCKQ